MPRSPVYYRLSGVLLLHLLWMCSSDLVTPVSAGRACTTQALALGDNEVTTIGLFGFAPGGGFELSIGVVDPMRKKPHVDALGIVCSPDGKAAELLVEIPPLEVEDVILDPYASHCLYWPLVPSEYTALGYNGTDVLVGEVQNLVSLFFRVGVRSDVEQVEVQARLCLWNEGPTSLSAGELPLSTTSIVCLSCAFLVLVFAVR